MVGRLALRTISTEQGASLICQNFTTTVIEIGASGEGESGRIVV